MTASLPFHSKPNPLDLRQPSSALVITLDREPLALRSTRNRPRRAVRRGASWTAAYHLQLTVVAVARPVRSSVMPSSSVLLSGPGVDRPDGVCPAEPPAGRRCRRGRHCPDAAGRRSPVSACGVHPSGSSSGIGCPAVWCPARPGSGHSGSSSRVRRSGRLLSGPSGVQPSAVHPSGVSRPVSSRLLSAPVWLVASVSSHLRRWRWDQVQAAGQPSPQQPVEVPVGGRAVGRLVDGRAA